jgi:hypothetical protein
MGRLVGRDKGMRIIAKRGEDSYILLTNDKTEKGLEKGRIVDIGQNKIFPEQYIQSFLARGYWEEYNLSEEGTKKFLEDNNLKL